MIDCNVQFNETGGFFNQPAIQELANNIDDLNILIKNQLEHLTVLSAKENPNYTEFIKNPLPNNICKLDDTKSYAVMKEDKMVALILRKLMPKNVIDDFKKTQFSYEDPTRGSAGVAFSQNGEKLKEEFKRLHGESMELSPAGKYIFTGVNVDSRKDIIFDVLKQHEVLTGFKIFTPLKTWSSSNQSLCDVEKQIIERVPLTKLSGTFDFGKYYFQKKSLKTGLIDFNETVIAEMEKTTINRKNFNRSLLTVNFGSTSCFGNKGATKSQKDEISSVKVCTPTSFENCGILNDIRNLANSIFKSVDDNSVSCANLNLMLSAHKENVKKLASWCADGYFSHINLNFTYPDKPTTNFHTDTNVAPQNLAALFVTGTEYIGGETVMPELLVDGKVFAVDMKEGDFMLFQSKDFLHGNLQVKQNFSDGSTSISEHAHHSENRRSLVFYLDSRFDHCDHFNKNAFEGTPQKANVRLLQKQNKSLKREGNKGNKLQKKVKTVVKRLEIVENIMITEENKSVDVQPKVSNWSSRYLPQESCSYDLPEGGLQVHPSIYGSAQPLSQSLNQTQQYGYPQIQQYSYSQSQRYHPQSQEYGYPQSLQSIKQVNENKRKRPFNSAQMEVKKTKFLNLESDDNMNLHR